MKQKLLLLFSFAFISSISYSQETQVIHSNEKIIIKSKILKEDRTILVRLPVNYAQGTAKYPVVYMLDGQNPRINLMTGSIENLVSADMIPDMIVVSIPNTDRRRDMTPSVVETQPGSGGAENFIKFFEKELIPEINSKYRTNPYRIIVGHSLSGLFVVYAFSAQPELFNVYLAASPHLQWDNHYMLTKGEELLKSRKELKRTLLVGLGDEPFYLQGFNGFNDLLKKLSIKNLEYEFWQDKAENHTSINAPVFHNGLRKVWSALQLAQPDPPNETSLSLVENHYKKASEKYGYEFPVPEAFLNVLGYNLMRTEKLKEALVVFERNVKLYPESANVYDSYAEALERDGQLQKAKDNLETGLKLAEKHSNQGMIDVMNENLKRVKGKLGH